MRYRGARASSEQGRPAASGRRGPGGRAGFTLIELMLSLSVMVVLLGAMAGVISATSRATEAGADRNARAAAASSALAEIASDLRVATLIDGSNGTELNIVVPDRTGDGIEESIQYRWSGVSGEPLRRVMNGNAASVILEDVRELDLAVIARKQPTMATVGPAVIAMHGGSGGGSVGEVTLGSGGAVGQAVLPLLSASAVDWQPTQVRFRAKRSGLTDGAILVQVLESLPGGRGGRRLIAEATLNESSLSTTTQWASVNLTASASVPAGAGVLVTLTSVQPRAGGALGALVGGLGQIVGSLLAVEPSPKDAAVVEVERGRTTINPSSGRMALSDDGSNWKLTDASDAIYFQLSGRWRTVEY